MIGFTRSSTIINLTKKFSFCFDWLLYHFYNLEYPGSTFSFTYGLGKIQVVSPNDYFRDQCFFSLGTEICLLHMLMFVYGKSNLQ